MVDLDNMLLAFGISFSSVQSWWLQHIVLVWNPFYLSLNMFTSVFGFLFILVIQNFSVDLLNRYWWTWFSCFFHGKGRQVSSQHDTSFKIDVFLPIYQIQVVNNCFLLCRLPQFKEEAKAGMVANIRKVCISWPQKPEIEITVIGAKGLLQ